MNSAEKEKLKKLSSWLLRNGYKKEAFLVKESLMGPTPQRIEEIKKRNLSPDSPSLIDSIQFGLDLAGFIPGIGEIADFINTIIYIIRGKWFEAALSILAMLPFLGIASTLLKRLTPKEEAIKAISEAIQNSGVSLNSVESQVDNLLVNLDLALKKLKESMPDEYSRNVPANSLDLVKAEIDQILDRIRSVKYEPFIRGSNRPKRGGVFDNDIASYWQRIDPATIKTLSESANTAVEKALVRTADYLGENLRLKIKRLYPNLSEEAYNLIEKQTKDQIKKIRILKAEDLQSASDYFPDPNTALANYAPTRGEITLNLPFLLYYSASQGRQNNVINIISEATQHEITHNLDQIIGKSYHEVLNVGRFDGATGQRTRYPKTRGGVLIDQIPTSGGEIPDFDRASKYFSGIKGTPIADNINKAVRNKVLQGDEYLTDFAEVAVRFRALKALFKNNGASSILNIIRDNNISLDKNALLILRRAVNPDDYFSQILSIGYLYQRYPNVWKIIEKNMDYSVDVGQLASMIDLEKFGRNPEVLVNILRDI